MIRGECISFECDKGSKVDIRLLDDADYYELKAGLDKLRAKLQKEDPASTEAVPSADLIVSDTAMIGHVCVRYSDPSVGGEIDKIVSGPVLDSELHVIAETLSDLKAS